MNWRHRDHDQRLGEAEATDCRCSRWEKKSYRVHFLEEGALQAGHGGEGGNVASDPAENGRNMSTFSVKKVKNKSQM